MFSSGREPLLIQDTRKHPIACNMPVTYEANVGSYLGVPIFYKSGDFFGTLCTVDSKPSNFTETDVKTLVRLSKFFTYVLELEAQVKRDSLTGLYNRHYLNNLFEEVITPNSSSKGTIMFLDLDGFKGVNDKYGHELGDLVLKEVAARINRCLTEGASGVRLGGDEFILLFPEMVDRYEIEQKAQEILEKMSNWHIHQHKLNLSTSIGITIYPDDDTHLSVLLKHADTALYKAKKCGKNNFQYFH
ncbi:sensor domain-containing diguanylate cyclase [Neobacillus vireti]|uniref:sensor domain-containing diguanylate cyclase n=1 Tax=Neobacillus vireti TaxID=220686 RepID=UPI002FFE6DED